MSPENWNAFERRILDLKDAPEETMAIVSVRALRAGYAVARMEHSRALTLAQENQQLRRELAAMGKPADENRFLILDKPKTADANGIAAWWRPGEQGYTNCLREAGRYSEEEALAVQFRMGDTIHVIREDYAMRMPARTIVDLREASP